MHDMPTEEKHKHTWEHKKYKKSGQQTQYSSHADCLLGIVMYLYYFI